jgi:type IV pilus assembly protein PilV
MPIINHNNIYIVKSSSGVALLEVLITILVIAFGLLGLLSLQTSTMLSATQTNQYYVATMSAQDMGERIRANAENLASYQMDDFGRGSINCDGVCEIDINDWHNNISGPENGPITANAIPNAEGQIQLRNTPSGLVADVSVRWVQQGEPQPFTYTLEVPINANIRP